MQIGHAKNPTVWPYASWHRRKDIAAKCYRLRKVVD